jgi:hypothetical protein
MNYGNNSNSLMWKMNEFALRSQFSAEFGAEQLRKQKTEKKRAARIVSPGGLLAGAIGLRQCAVEELSHALCLRRVEY